MGLEPIRLTAHAPQTCLSTNSNTWAGRDCKFANFFSIKANILSLILHSALTPELFVYFRIGMLKKLFILLILALNTGLSAQRDSVQLEDGTVLYNLPAKRPPKNALFIELGGNGGIYSLNYDRILVNKARFRTSLRGGFALLPVDRTLDLIFVAEHNFLFGRERHFIESGLGLNYIRSLQFEAGSTNYVSEQGIGVLRLGYRYQERMDEGLFFRAGLTPFLLQTNEHDKVESIFQFWMGLSAGANF